MRASRLFIPLVALTVTCILAVTTAEMRLNEPSSTPTNSPPVANPDSYTVHGSLVLDLLANDSDPDGDPIFLDGLPLGPQHGVVGIVSQTVYSYTANPGYVGPDSFTYAIRDPSFANGSATVTINVVNQAPVANADSYTSSQRNPRQIKGRSHSTTNDQENG